MPPSTSSATTPPSPLIAFYAGSGTDTRNRRLSTILAWDFEHLEYVHDYIQILFPLPEASGVSWNAPIITREVFNAFRSHDQLRENMRRALGKMCWFYGFDCTYDAHQISPSSSSSSHGKNDNDNNDGGVKVTITPSPSIFRAHASNWDTRFNHNHLRITRVIRSLRVLGLEVEAQAFYTAMKTHARNVSAKSKEFWRRAAERPLNVRPDMEEVDGVNVTNVGLKFLREWEESEKERERKTKMEGEEHEMRGSEDGKDERKKKGEGSGGAHKDIVGEGEEEEWEGIKDD